jgi:hypothetical protein
MSTLNSSFMDRDADFWALEAKSLSRKFDRCVRERLATGALNHLSVFSLAPQPLLILLGTMLGDIVPCDVYQRHREPYTWNWPLPTREVPAFQVKRPENMNRAPALVLALSGTVNIDRIVGVLGGDVSIWTITVPTPHNELIKTRAQLSEFRSVSRLLFDEIKAAYDESTLLHVFPVAAVSVAVEFGRARMPKADMPWRVYDQISGRGFVNALDIPYGENE